MELYFEDGQVVIELISLQEHFEKIGLMQILFCGPKFPNTDNNCHQHQNH